MGCKSILMKLFNPNKIYSKNSNHTQLCELNILIVEI